MFNVGRFLRANTPIDVVAANMYGAANGNLWHRRLSIWDKRTYKTSSNTKLYQAFKKSHEYAAQADMEVSKQSVQNEASPDVEDILTDNEDIVIEETGASRPWFKPRRSPRCNERERMIPGKLKDFCIGRFYRCYSTTTR